MSDPALALKLENAIIRTGARVVLTANAGCQLQSRAGAARPICRCKVMHPMELMYLSYRGAKLDG